MKNIFRLRLWVLVALIGLGSQSLFAESPQQHDTQEKQATATHEENASIQDPTWKDAPAPPTMEEKYISPYAINEQLEQNLNEEGTNTTTIWMWVIGILMVLVLGGIGAVMSDLRKLTGAAATNYNKLNAQLMLGFMVLFLGGIFYEVVIHGKHVNLDSASEHGVQIDNMMITTLLITGIVFIITQILLFWFAYKYQYKEGRKALYYPENDKLEIAWTAIPAVVLTILVLFGFRTWNNTMIYHEMRDHDYTTEAYPYQIELFAYQFGWQFRYPGPDGILGEYDFRNIDYGEKKLAYTNPLGLDVKDPNAKDDIILPFLKLPKDRTVRLVMRSSDVLHAAHLPQFNAQIYCIPNEQTEFHIKALYTTEEKRAREQDPEFEYELACNQICGRAHYAMRQAVEVMTEDDFETWMAEQKPAFADLGAEKKEENETTDKQLSSLE